MENGGTLQFMYRNDTFYCRTTLPNGVSSEWVELTKDHIISRMEHRCEVELERLKDQYLHAFHQHNEPVFELVSRFRAEQIRILQYYNPAKYELFKKQLIKTMYLRDDCIMCDRFLL
jgi:hypothetical protein